jgi:hypothetical protein
MLWVDASVSEEHIVPVFKIEVWNFSLEDGGSILFWNIRISPQTTHCHNSEDHNLKQMYFFKILFIGLYILYAN